MGTISKVKLNGTEHLIASTAYAICTTSATTAAKVATVQNNHAFSLVEGETIHVYFKYSNTASSPTLNINNTGAKPIRQHGSTAPVGWGSAWRDQSIISFTYNTDLISTGCWLINDFSYQNALTVDFDYQYAYSEGFDTEASTVEDAIIDVYNQTKNVNPDWSASAGASSILNKPVIPSTAADVNAAPSQHTHNADEIQYTGRISAVSGNDLTDIVSNIYDQLEVMPATQINSDWTASAGVSSILNKPTIPSAADLTPKMDGTGATGSSATFARADHVHPTDTSRASSSHAHGSVTSDGKITATGITLANGDALVVTDSSASHAIKKTSITFDGSTTTQALTKKGTWESFPNPNWNAITGVSSILNKPSIVNAIDGVNGVVTLKTTTIGSATAGTNISADDITTWTTNTPTQVTKKTVVTSVTPATVVTGGTKTGIPNVTGVGTLPSLSYTAKTVGSASGWSQGSMTEATYSNGILQITTGTLPTLTITNVDCDDITAWTSGTTPTLGTAISAYTALTTGAAATVSTGDSVTVTAGVAASLSYTSRSIPNVSVATTTVVTGVN